MEVAGALVCIMLVSVVNGLRVQPSGHGSLLTAIQMIADHLQVQAQASSTAGNAITSTAPPPGRINICDDLCPKWCEKVAGTDNNFTHCHYVCSNICSDKISRNNPYIGDSRFEVVPSVFDFKTYDKNEDKQISKQEFATHEGVPVEEVSKTFVFADLNGDGFIDSDEFRRGPFIFTVQMAAELSNMGKQRVGQTNTSA